MQLIKKIGSKQVLGNVAAFVKENLHKEGMADGAVSKAYTMFGIVSGVKTGASTYGEWTAFVGQIEAVNHFTGETFAAGQGFIPEPLQTMLVNALRETDTVEFAFTVSIKRRDDLERGYEYIVEPLVQAKQADPLAHLKRAALEKMPELQIELQPEPAAEEKAAKAKK